MFFALWPPAELAATLADFAQGVAGELGGRPTRRETIHLTLVFLGEVPAVKLDDLVAIGRRVRADRFDLKIDRLGHWSHNRLFWAGCGEVPAGLCELQQRLRLLLADAGYARGAAERSFTPHVTLIRKLPAATDHSCSVRFACPQDMAWRCASFVLVRSVLTPEGPSYRILETFPLH